MSESAIQRSWRPCAAFVYLFICLLDFAIMPIIVEARKPKMNDVTLEALKFTDASVQVQLIQNLTKERQWVPLTLDGTGLFHLSFGAILTGAAVTRGLEKIRSTS